MKNKLLYSFEEDLAKRLKNPAFRKAWKVLGKIRVISEIREKRDILNACG